MFTRHPINLRCALTRYPVIDPPYDGHAVWHIHHFRPGASGQCLDAGRIDEVEDRLGRIFVWDVDSQQVIFQAPSRSAANVLASMWIADDPYNMAWISPGGLALAPVEGQERDGCPEEGAAAAGEPVDASAVTSWPLLTRGELLGLTEGKSIVYLYTGGSFSPARLLTRRDAPDLVIPDQAPISIARP